MEEESMTLKYLGIHAEGLLGAVLKQQDHILERLCVQDDQFNRLWDAYTSIGVADPDCFKRLIEPLREKMLEVQDDGPYWKQYKQTSEELNRLLGHLKNHDNRLEALKQTERVIVDLVMLLNFQWEKLVALLGSICDQIKVCRDTKLASLAKYKSLKPTLKNDPKREKLKLAYACEKEQLINQQIQLFNAEKWVLDRLEQICDERDRLLLISHELFLR